MIIKCRISELLVERINESTHSSSMPSCATVGPKFNRIADNLKQSSWHLKHYCVLFQDR